MKNFIKKYFFDLLLIFILSLTPLLWFQSNTMMVGHDNVFPLNPAVFLNGRLFSWIELGFGRSQALIMGTIPVHLIDAIPYLLGFSLQATQKIVYVFWFFLMGVSAYVLASVLNKESRYFKLTAVVFYVFNFFILQAWWIGERTKFSAYIAFPLILAVFYKVYKGELKTVKGAILTSLILFVFNGGGLFGTPLFGGYFIALIAFILVFSFISFLQKEYNVVKRIILLAIFSSVGFFLVNAYYIFPTLSQVLFKYTEGVQKTGGVEGLINWASEISANASYSNLLRLQGIAEWYDNSEHPYSRFFLTNPVLIIISFVWPFLIFLTLFLVKTKAKLKLVIYFLIVYLLGVFFAAGTHPPFGFVYAFLMKTIPGFIIFRSPYFKFAPAIFLGASFLIAYFVDYFKGRKQIIVFSLIILTILIYHFPYFTGNFFEWRKGFSTRNQVPDYVFKFGQWAENEMDSNSRVLLLPPSNSNWQYDIYKWGYLSLQILPTLVTNKGIISSDDKVSGNEMMLLENLYEAIDDRDFFLTQKLIQALNIKYLLIRHDFESDLDWIPSSKPDFYETILEKDFNLVPVKQLGRWTIYQIDQNKGSKFSLIDKVNILYGPHKNFVDYYTFAKNNSNFIFDSDINFSVSHNSAPYIIPECLNCRHELSPSINFPRRQILPDSLLYRIVKYKEQNELRGLTPRETVYADLGHSLKRAGEILVTLDQGKKLSPELFVNYLGVFKRIRNDFNEVNDFKEKFEVAEDINYYLIPQKNYLSQLLGSKVNEKEILEKVDKIFDEIFNIETVIDPYLFKLDISNNRFFQFNIKNTDSYEVLLKKKDFASHVKDESEIKLLLDGQEKKGIEMIGENINNEWFSFGKFNFSSGDHSLLLSLPPLPNLLDNFSNRKDWFGIKIDNYCYGDSIKNYNNKGIYKLKLEIVNDFSEAVQLYEVRDKSGRKIINSVSVFKKHFEKDNYETLIYASKDVDNISIYVCSANLDEAFSQNKIKINLKEVIYPNLIIKPVIEGTYYKEGLSYKKINPTKYIIDVTSSKPNFLTFSERYDNGWELSDFKSSHFRVNGYANGWYLNRAGNYQLTLEYKPQRYFYYGILVSLISVIGGLIFLIYYARRTKPKRNLN